MGNIEEREVENLRQGLASVAVPPVKRVILDFTRVNYVGSAGIGLLLALHKRLAEQGGGLVLTGLSPALRAIFTTVRLDRIFSLI